MKCRVVLQFTTLHQLQKNKHHIYERVLEQYFVKF